MSLATDEKAAQTTIADQANDAIAAPAEKTEPPKTEAPKTDAKTEAPKKAEKPTKAEKPAKAEKTEKPAEKTLLAGDDKKPDAEKTEKTEEVVYDLTAPEGVEVDVEAIKAFAKEQGLTPAQAQKVLERDVAQQQAVIAKTLELSRTVWVDQIKSDKEIGGARFAESVQIAKRAVDAYAPPGMKEFLDASGYGNHPLFVRFCFNAGRALASDKVIPATNAAGNKPSMAQRLYGSSAPKQQE